MYNIQAKTKMTHTKRHGKKMSSRRHRHRRGRGRRMMKGGYSGNNPFSPATFTSNGNGAAAFEPATVGTFNQQMQNSDSPAMAMSNGLDYRNINPAIMASSQSGAMQIQNGGSRKNQLQRGGVWNQMIGEAVAPLVLLGLQQYYGPRSKSNRGSKGNRTRRYRK
uniref:Uncharacterized protein n=1 Tax=viral metagenome TaxID=1070528 RepID=A0A6C0E620_9ZZZZ